MLPLFPATTKSNGGKAMSTGRIHRRVAPGLGRGPDTQAKRPRTNGTESGSESFTAPS